jgi:hypothetical protein
MDSWNEYFQIIKLDLNGFMNQMFSNNSNDDENQRCHRWNKYKFITRCSFDICFFFVLLLGQIIYLDSNQEIFF